MNRKVFLIIFLLSCFIINGCARVEVGDISNVRTNIVNLNEHNKKDIEETFAIIKNQFQTVDFRDCKLLTIEYTDEYADKEKELLISEQDASEVIVLSFIFQTGNNPENIFNKNSTYEYTADFIKSNGGNWKMVNWGQG